MRLDAEDARVQNAALVSNIVVDNVVAGVEDSAEEMRKGEHRIERDAFEVFCLFDIVGEQADEIGVALDDFQIIIHDDDGRRHLF